MNTTRDLMPGTASEVSFDRPVVLANISRRRFLQGVSALGGLVLAAGLPVAAARRRPSQVRRRRHAEWLGGQPAGVRRHRPGWHGLDRLPPLGDGAGRADRHADDRGRRARGGLEARAGRAGDRGREALRQPGHRRLAQHAALPGPDAPLRRRRADDARSGGGGALEGSRQRGRGQEPRGGASPDRPAPRVRRARQGRGESAGAGARDGAAQGSVEVPLHRQGPAEAGRWPRTSPPARRSTASTRGSTACSTRWWRVRRCWAARSRASTPPRRSRSRAWCAWCRSTPSPPPVEFNPLGGVAVIARNTWAAIQGRNALKIVWDDGPNAKLRLGGASRRRSRRRRASPGKVVRNNGDFDAAVGERREAPHRRVLHSPSRPRHHGAAGGDRAHRQRQVRGVGVLSVAPGRAGSGGEAARHVGGRRDRERHAARRRVRTQVQGRLRRGGGRPVQGDGRQAGQGDVDARRRPAQLLLPHGVGGAPGGGGRRAGQARRLAAPERGADHLLDLRRGRQAGGAARARHGRHQRAVRDPQHPHREPGGRGAYAHRLVPLGLEHSACVRRPVVRRRARRRRRAATRRTSSWK